MTDHPIEVWIAMNEEGDYDVGVDPDTASERCRDNCGGQQCRLVLLKVMMTAPQVTEVSITVPDEAGQSITIKVE